MLLYSFNERILYSNSSDNLIIRTPKDIIKTSSMLVPFGFHFWNILRDFTIKTFKNSIESRLKLHENFYICDKNPQQILII